MSSTLIYVKKTASVLIIQKKQKSLPQSWSECGFCGETFTRESEYDQHHRVNDSGCFKHNMCFPSSENEEHAREYDHENCFVPNCKITEEFNTNWGDKEVLIHVQGYH